MRLGSKRDCHTAEVLNPDRRHSGNLQTRFSVGGEYTPMQYLQLRLGGPLAR